VAEGCAESGLGLDSGGAGVRGMAEAGIHQGPPRVEGDHGAKPHPTPAAGPRPPPLSTAASRLVVSFLACRC